MFLEFCSTIFHFCWHCSLLLGYRYKNNYSMCIIHYHADELIVSGMDYLQRELRRRSKRSPYSSFDTKKRGSELNARRYQKELARALRLQNRRSKSKALIRTPETNVSPESNSSLGFIYGTSGVQAVEERLGKLKETIQGMKLRLGALRDLRKKLRQISSRDRLIE